MQFGAIQVMLKSLGVQFGGIVFKKKSGGWGLGSRHEKFELGVTVITFEMTASVSLSPATRKDSPEGNGRVGAKSPASSFEGSTVKLNGMELKGKKRDIEWRILIAL